MPTSSYEERLRAEILLRLTFRDTDDPRGPMTPAEIAKAEQFANERIAEWKRRRRG